MNKCSHCGRNAAGHMALYGVPHGPRCTLQPLQSEELSAAGGHSSDMNGSTETSLVEKASPQATTDSGPVTAQPPPAATNSPSTSTPTSSETVVLTNEQMEEEYRARCQVLMQKIQEAEAKAQQKTIDNIHLLADQSRYLQARLDQLNSSAAANQVPDTSAPGISLASAPPASNPLAPPPTTAGISASSFGQSAPRIQPANTATSAPIHGIPSAASLSFGTTPTASAVSFGGLTQPAVIQSAAATQNPFGQAPSAPLIDQSALALHSSWPNLGNTHRLQMAAQQNLPQNNFVQQISQNTQHFPQSTQVPQVHSSSLPDIQAALLAANPQILSNAAVKPDDIIKANNIARAMVGLSAPDIAKDESSILGKYIPELFSIKYGKSEDIRARMTYHEFIAMYVRMLVTMLKDDPALIPDRITFLNAFTTKAARHRWPPVRNAYTSAMHQIKQGRRKWADDLTELFADHLDTHTMVRLDQSSASSSSSHQAKVGFPCRDWNDKSCNRTRCKFLHECSNCHQDHPARYCASSGGGYSAASST